MTGQQWDSMPHERNRCDRLPPFSSCPNPDMNDRKSTDQKSAQSGSIAPETMLPCARSKEHEAGRRFGIRDGLFQAVTQSSGEQYLSAFALLLHATPFHLSVLSAVPQLVGTWAQLVSVKASRWFPDRKSQVLSGMIGQSVSWLPIVALPLLWPEIGPWLLIIGAAAYFACTHFAAPAWNSLITDWIDANERGMYFARRARVMAVTSFVILCVGGGFLSFFEQENRLWAGFAILFLIAGISRSLSARLLTQLSDVPTCPAGNNPSGFRAFLRDGSSRDFHYFLLFSSLMHAAVLIAGPFFVLYMIEDLQLSYWQYGAWLGAGIIGQFMTLPAWGQFGDRFGNKALLTMTGYIVPVLPMMYLFSTAWPFLMIVNFFGGVVWAGLSLGLQNYVFDAVREADRAKAVAVVSVVNALGWAAGTFFGSWLIGILPVTFHVPGLRMPALSNLPMIFFISGALRLVVAGLLLKTFQEPRPVERRSHPRLVCELPLLKPLCQLAFRGRQA
jgi:MFS family permease